MPLLSSGGDSASIAADFLENSAKMLVNEITNWSAQCDAGSVHAHGFITAFMLQRLIPTRDKWIVLEAVPGVQLAVRNRWPGKWANDSLVTTELATCRAGMTTLIDWLATNIQATLTNGSGYVEVIKVEGTPPALTYRQVTTNLAALKTQLTTLKNLLVG